jgi:hypothetical protein
VDGYLGFSTSKSWEYSEAQIDMMHLRYHPLKRQLDGFEFLFVLLKESSLFSWTMLSILYLLHGHCRK